MPDPATAGVGVYAGDEPPRRRVEFVRPPLDLERPRTPSSVDG